MTQQRALKLRVRERMARTGESYSSARRHVLARAATSWPAAVTGYDRCGGGVHHDSALLHNVLRASGIKAPHTGEPWTEAMLAGLAGGIGFMYFVFEYAGHHPMMTIVARHHPEPYLPAALRRAGVEFDQLQTGSARKAVAALRAVQGPAICTVVRDLLPWNEARGDMFGQDPCDVAVIGADGNTLYVDDELPAPIAVAEDEFVAAWSAYRKGKHSMLTISGARDIDLGAAVAEAVATTCAHLTGPVLGNSFDVNFGFSGADKFVAQLRDPRGKTGWTQRYAHPDAFSTALNRLHDCLEVEYAGPGALRPLYADFLDEAGAALNRPAYREAAALFRGAGESWSAVAGAALAAAGDPTDHRALLDGMADQAATAINHEKQAVSLLTQ